MLSSRPIRRPELCGRQVVIAISIAIAALVGVASCGPPPSPDALPSGSSERGPRLHFEFVTVDDQPLSSETLAGRFSVIGFVATYDVASQAQARLLADLLRHHKPRINVALLVLEAPENKPLVQAFASALHAGYPIALADAATIAGSGPFTGLHHVPSIVILDREGREVWRRLGISDEATLEAALKSVEQREPAPPLR